ncbi:DUF6928 family protein [Actinoplanes derwentensis]|uniref:DUF6928 family protein n=1 Tax=Actinoplanes derwentensis TaxID=113562 RepID=UPI000B81D583
MEDIGEPFPFERPYLAGEHPVTSMFPVQGPYPLPFHPSPDRCLVSRCPARRWNFSCYIVDRPACGVARAGPTGR